MIEEQQDRHDRQHRRNGKTDAPKAHEVELGVVGNDAKEAHWTSFRCWLLSDDVHSVRDLIQIGDPLFGVMR
jgi:hypothetical protein